MGSVFGRVAGWFAFDFSLSLFKPLISIPVIISTKKRKVLPPLVPVPGYHFEPQALMP